jgi:hypothetical protein
MEWRQERVEPLDRVYDLSSLSGEVEAVAWGDRSMQQCPRGYVRPPGWGRRPGPGAPGGAWLLAWPSAALAVTLGPCRLAEPVLRRWPGGVERVLAKPALQLGHAFLERGGHLSERGVGRRERGDLGAQLGDPRGLDGNHGRLRTRRKPRTAPGSIHLDGHVSGNGGCHHQGVGCSWMRSTHFTHQKPRLPGATNRAGNPCLAASGAPPTRVASSSRSTSPTGDRNPAQHLRSDHDPERDLEHD